MAFFFYKHYTRNTIDKVFLVSYFLNALILIYFSLIIGKHILTRDNKKKNDLNYRYEYVHKTSSKDEIIKNNNIYMKRKYSLKVTDCYSLQTCNIKKNLLNSLNFNLQFFLYFE